MLGGLNGCDGPLWNRADYEVRGSLNPDRTCTVLIDGQPALKAGAFYPDSTEYHREFAVNVGLGPGDDFQDVMCQGVSFAFRGRKGELLKPGRYSIQPDGLGRPTLAGALGSLRARQINAGSWPLALPNVYLMGIKGEIILTHVDSVLVAGTFRFAGVRRSSM